MLEIGTVPLIIVPMNAAVVPSLLNLFTGQFVETVGFHILGGTYFVLVCIGIAILIPNVIKEKKLQVY